MKYDKIVGISRERSEQKVRVAIYEIDQMLLKKQRVTVSALEKVTGFSNSFFYRNQEVKDAIKRAQLNQGECYNPKKVISDLVLEHKVRFLEEKTIKMKREILQLERDKARLMKENADLEKVIEGLKEEIHRLKQ